MKMTFRLMAMLLFPLLAAAQDPSLSPPLAAADGLKNKGQFKEALALYETFAKKPDSPGAFSAEALRSGVECLNRLNLQDKTDAFIESVAAAHSNDWRVLQEAARQTGSLPHYGYIVAGEFTRGAHRGQGRYVQVDERDRIRALQLAGQALAATIAPPAEFAELLLEVGRLFQNQRLAPQQSWKLQVLTDTSVLPPWDDARPDDSRTSGAPVDEKGNAVFYAVPASYAAAANDGERIRWLQAQAIQQDPTVENRVLLDRADFLDHQFGVQTLADQLYLFRQDEDGADTAKSLFQLESLAENETIARLATGVKRFSLPDDQSAAALWKTVSQTQAPEGETALGRLATFYQNRRQYEKAAECLKSSIARFGTPIRWKQQQLDQITGNWGAFEPLHPQSPKGPSFDFRFRNGRSVSFEAKAIDIARLLQDIKDYLKSNPKELDWNRLQIDNLGWRLIQTNESRYIGETAAQWSQDLEPRARHFDRRITVQAPLKKAGAYWITARMAQGNVNHLVLWVQDTILVEKPLADRMLLYLADAESGAPVTNARISAFRYKTDWKEAPGGKRGWQEVTTGESDLTTDSNGLARGPADKQSNWNWLYTAVTPEGRFAFQGFSSHWFGGESENRLRDNRTYVITDRPVYRPGHAVQIKAWISPVRYDLPETPSEYAGKKFTLRIHDPHGEKVMETTLAADAYGGISGSWSLPAGAALGTYGIEIDSYGNGSFRVEEYKKPEFEVTVEAPSDPLALGDAFKAVIKARYHFGAPVTKGRVKWKVERRTYAVNWFPWGPWDWLYGRGYGWLAVDTDWYPGWARWGCFRPFPWWRPTPYTQPEIVAESTVPIGADGTVTVPIDTALAKALFGNTDHQYTISAEVTDESRRTITGSGQVIAAREPFKVYAWTGRGYYRAGDTIHAFFSARRPDGKPVSGKGKARLLKLAYRDGVPAESTVQEWPLEIGETGEADLQMLAAQAGQYRLSVTVAAGTGKTLEGACLVTVRGEGFASADYRFNALELIPDKAVYNPGETVHLLMQADRADTTLLLFTRPVNGVYREPEAIRLSGKSAVSDLAVTVADMPNFFVEALSIHGGQAHTEMREILVPPETRVLTVTVEPKLGTIKPGATNTVVVKAAGPDGKPVAASLVLAVYDKALEYISGGSNVPEIREFFWKWRRQHQPVTRSNAERLSQPVTPRGATAMGNLGLFGGSVADGDRVIGGGSARGMMLRKSARRASPEEGFAMNGLAAAPAMAFAAEASDSLGVGDARVGGEAPSAEAPAAIRKAFADTAFWAAALTTDSNGQAEVSFAMPENLGEWSARGWAFAPGARVGENTAKIVTTKNLLVRLQAPRFFIEKDEVVLSANIHNALGVEKKVNAVLELDGDALQPESKMRRDRLIVPANGEIRVDWTVRAVKEGNAVIRMKALSDEESDAMQMEFPVYIHGMLKTEAWSGVIRPETNAAAFTLNVPQARRPDQTKLEIRWSPTLAGAMIDALPYLAAYPHGCTEQTLNRFLPSVITRRVLQKSGLNLESLREKRNNLNAQERGDPRKRAEGWKRFPDNPVFDSAELDTMVKNGVARLADMQSGDGGWNWFPGWTGESSPHMTAQIVHGLYQARDCGVAVPGETLDRGIEWLKTYAAAQAALLKNAEAKKDGSRWKVHADNLDALVYWTLVEAGGDRDDLRGYLYRDRLQLSLYGQGLLGLGLEKQGKKDELAMVLANIGQFVEQDDENQTAWLRMNNGGYWWFWFGDEIEAHAVYLKLLAKTNPKDERAGRLVKYLLNNRKHATYWNSTRDTAMCIEALADYLAASGEGKPDMAVETWLDGKRIAGPTAVTADTLFTVDNTVSLEGAALAGGPHKLEIRRTGSGPVYFNAYLENFTLEDPLTAAGLEVKIQRKLFKLVEADKVKQAGGARGQAVGVRVDRYDRKELKNGDVLKSGDLVEVELKLDSKNDYEYLVVEDMKAAGFEPVDVRSGYTGNELGAYMEFRDERVCLYLRTLARGANSVTYRVRAEIPGRFSVLPARIWAMYAPELRGNSDEQKIGIAD